jgi:hypothetical protein
MSAWIDAGRRVGEVEVSNPHAAECLTDEKGPDLFARGWSHAAFWQVSRLFPDYPGAERWSRSGTPRSASTPSGGWSLAGFEGEHQGFRLRVSRVGRADVCTGWEQLR